MKMRQVSHLRSGTPTEIVDSSQMPVVMMINSSELKAADFTLREVFSPELDGSLSLSHPGTDRGTFVMIVGALVIWAIYTQGQLLL